jgi:hypothetical protein
MIGWNTLTDHRTATCQQQLPNQNMAWIDLSKVRGTHHPGYCEKTWFELLPTNPDAYEHIDCGERWAYQGEMKNGWTNLRELRSNPAYYLEVTPKILWSFAKIGEEYYITQGNHRTIMGRFLLSVNGLPQLVRGVSVTEYHV